MGNVALSPLFKNIMIGGVIGVGIVALLFFMAGLTPSGITGGSLAALLMSTYGGTIASGSLISTLQWLSASWMGMFISASSGFALGAAVAARKQLWELMKKMAKMIANFLRKILEKAKNFGEKVLESSKSIAVLIGNKTAELGKEVAEKIEEAKPIVARFVINTWADFMGKFQKKN